MKLKATILGLVLGLSLCCPSFARVILIYAGTPRGGTGDVAANWVMAKHLRALLPQSDEIYFAVDESIHEVMLRTGFSEESEPAADLLARLIPRYQPSQARTFEGIHLRSFNRHSLPRADYGLAFSIRPSDGSHGRLVDKSNLSLIFGDLASSAQQTHRPLAERVREDASNRAFFHYGVSDTEWGTLAALDTGAEFRGIYTLPYQPEPPLTREALLSALLPYAIPKWSGRVAVNWGWQRHPLKDRLLGLAYSFLAGPTQKYIEAMKVVARREKFKDKKITIFVKYFSDLRFDDIPENLEVFPFQTMPFSVFESLVAHADLPIQITGNVSLSQAAQYAKPFFMDNAAPAHMTGGPGALLTRMRQQDPYFRQPQFDGFLSSDGLASSYNASVSSQMQFGVPLWQYAALLEDAEFSAHFQSVLNALRPTWSLPLTVVRYLDLLDKNPTVRSVGGIAEILDAADGRPGARDLYVQQLREIDQSCARYLTGGI